MCAGDDPPTPPGGYPSLALGKPGMRVAAPRHVGGPPESPGVGVPRWRSGNPGYG